MYLRTTILVLGFLFAGCGENSNVPLAGDIAELNVRAATGTFYATETVHMEANVTYTNGVTERNVTKYIDWSESNSSIATVDVLGLVSGAQYGGDVNITGSYDQFYDTVTLHAHALTSVEINATDTNVSQEQTLQLHALGTFDDNTTRDVTNSMTWVLGNKGDSNASLEQNGTLYTGDANGTLDINVSRYDVNATLQITVTP